MEERIVKVVAQVFGVPEESLTGSSGPQSIPTWDSLAHLNLVLALEAEFGVQFTPDDAMRMVTVEAIGDVLRAQ